jgi:hypothetical protein
MPTNPLGNKICTGCHQSKSFSEFGVFVRAKDGRKSRCLSCMKVFRAEDKEKANIRRRNVAYRLMHGRHLHEYEISRRVSRKAYKQQNKDKFKYLEAQRILQIQQIIWKMKQQPCHDCGRKFHPIAMDFDHLTMKVKNISRMARKNSMKKIMDEISKCDLVCKNCHRIRTKARINLCPETPSLKSQRRKRDLVNMFKSKPCIDCGLIFRPECMDFDHAHGSKLFSISSGVTSKGYKALLAEITKTELVCAVCHQLRTMVRRAA